MTKTFITTALLITISTPAFAKSDMAPNSAVDAAHWLRDARAGENGTLQYHGLDKNANGVTNCMADLESYRKDGDTQVYSAEFEKFGATRDSDGHYNLTIDQAEDICREGEHYRYVLFKDFDVIIHGDVDYDRLVQFDFGAEGIAQGIEEIKKCPAAVDAILAAGFAPSTPFKAGSAKTVGELKAMCEAGIKASEKYLAYVDQQGKKAAEPYLKAGIKDDKLDLMLKYDGSVFLTGGAAPDNLKQYAAASALFVWLTSDPDDAGYVVHTVDKYVFKGNRLVRTSEKTFRLKSGAKLGGGAFK